VARLIEGLRGHDKVWEQLQSLQERGRVPHALAFVGIEGIGKRMMAWAFAQALLCEKSPAEEAATSTSDAADAAADATRGPCGQCGACLRVEHRQSESVLAVAPESGTIKVEVAHQILDFLALKQLRRARVVLIEEAQKLNPQAANALLKVIEEPPPSTYFLLIVPEITQLLPTLRSRSQVLRFAPLPMNLLDSTADPSDWRLPSARGSFARLQSLRDEDVEGVRQKTWGFLQAAFRQDSEKMDEFVAQVRDREVALMAATFLQQFLRDWTVGENGAALHPDLNWSESATAPKTSDFHKSQLWRSAAQMETDVQAHLDRSLLFENFFYRVAHVVD